MELDPSQRNFLRPRTNHKDHSMRNNRWIIVSYFLCSFIIMFIMCTELVSFQFYCTQENQDLLIRCIAQHLGFSQGRPIAACIIYKCLLQWRSFEVERTSVFDRIIQAIGHAIEVCISGSTFSFSFGKHKHPLISFDFTEDSGKQWYLSVLAVKCGYFALAAATYPESKWCCRNGSTTPSIIISDIVWENDSS